METMDSAWSFNSESKSDMAAGMNLIAFRCD